MPTVQWMTVAVSQGSVFVADHGRTRMAVPGASRPRDQNATPPPETFWATTDQGAELPDACAASSRIITSYRTHRRLPKKTSGSPVSAASSIIFRRTFRSTSGEAFGHFAIVRYPVGPCGIGRAALPAPSAPESYAFISANDCSWFCYDRGRICPASLRRPAGELRNRGASAKVIPAGTDTTAPQRPLKPCPARTRADGRGR